MACNNRCATFLLTQSIFIGNESSRKISDSYVGSRRYKYKRSSRRGVRSRNFHPSSMSRMCTLVNLHPTTIADNPCDRQKKYVARKTVQTAVRKFFTPAVLWAHTKMHFQIPRPTDHHFSITSYLSGSSIRLNQQFLLSLFCVIKIFHNFCPGRNIYGKSIDKYYKNIR